MDRKLRLNFLSLFVGSQPGFHIGKISAFIRWSFAQRGSRLPGELDSPGAIVPCCP
jgi:hypothetical protein